MILEPRYHFAASVKYFYQRPVYRATTSNHKCKFISLGEIGQKDKNRKAIHAVLLTPMKDMRAETLYCGGENIIQNNNEYTIDPYKNIYNIYKNKNIYITDTYNKNEEICNYYDIQENTHIQQNINTDIHETPAQPPYKKCKTEESISNNKIDKKTNRGDYKREKCKRAVVYVQNLPYDEINEDSLTNVMAFFGKVKFINMPKNNQGKSIGKAWCVYMEEESAEKAAGESGNIEAGGRKLKISLWNEKIPYLHNNSHNRHNTEIVDIEPHADCWFCLANPNAEKHLVVHVGNEVYMSLAKGGLNEYHILIIPVSHYPNFIFLTDSAAKEMNYFITSIKNCFQNMGLETIIYERFVWMKRKNVMHMQIQVIPLQPKLAYHAADLFIEKGRSLKMHFTKLPATENIFFLRKEKNKNNFSSSSYFYFESPGDNTAKGRMVERYVCICGNGFRMPMNFGREVLVEIMNEPNKFDWKDCIMTSEQENLYAKNMRNIFLPFAPNL